MFPGRAWKLSQTTKTRAVPDPWYWPKFEFLKLLLPKLPPSLRWSGHLVTGIIGSGFWMWGYRTVFDDLLLTVSMQALIRELWNWNKLQHQNILGLDGVCFDETSPKSSLWILTSWQANGSVAKYVKENKLEMNSRVELVSCETLSCYTKS